MKRACYVTTQCVAFSLFFSIGHIYVATVPTYAGPAKSVSTNSNTSEKPVETKNNSQDIESLDNAHDEPYHKNSWREDCGDGEGDDENVEECIEDCREERNEALFVLFFSLSVTIVTCVVCFSSGTPPACITCILSAIGNTAAARNILDDFVDCKEDCISS